MPPSSPQQQPEVPQFAPADEDQVDDADAAAAWPWRGCPRWLPPLPPRTTPVRSCCALLRYNKFVEYEEEEEPEAVTCGRWKTVGFLLLMAGFIFRFWMKGSTTSVLNQYTLLNPSLDEYSGIAAFEPVCECRSTVAIEDFTSIHVPNAANYSLNVCQMIRAIFAACNGQAASGSHFPCRAGMNSSAATPVSGSLQVPVGLGEGNEGVWAGDNAPSLTLVTAFIPAMSALCDRLQESLDSTVHIVQTFDGLGTELLSPAQLQYTVASFATAEFRRSSMTSQALVQVLKSISDALAVTTTDLSVGANEFCVFGAPFRGNFSCHTAFHNPPSDAAYGAIVSGVRFQVAFDTRKWDADPCQYATFSCSLAASLMGQKYSFGWVPDVYGFPLQLFDSIMWNETLGLPPSQLPEYVRDYRLNWFPDLFNAVDLFILSGGTVRAGIFNVSFAEYYDTCEPSECTYFLAQKRGVLDLLIGFAQQGVGNLVECATLWVEAAGVAFLCVGYLRGACGGGDVPSTKAATATTASESKSISRSPGHATTTPSLHSQDASTTTAAVAGTGRHGAGGHHNASGVYASRYDSSRVRVVKRVKLWGATPPVSSHFATASATGSIFSHSDGLDAAQVHSSYGRSGSLSARVRFPTNVPALLDMHAAGGGASSTSVGRSRQTLLQQTGGRSFSALHTAREDSIQQLRLDNEAQVSRAGSDTFHIRL